MQPIKDKIKSWLYFQLDFTEVEKPNDYYRCVAPLRLLFLKEKNPALYQTVLTLMDHNEERKEDVPTWNTYKKYVNNFLKYVKEWYYIYYNIVEN